jgi:hypothetical protein
MSESSSSDTFSILCREYDRLLDEEDDRYSRSVSSYQTLLQLIMVMSDAARETGRELLADILLSMWQEGLLFFTTNISSSDPKHKEGLKLAPVVKVGLRTSLIQAESYKYYGPAPHGTYELGVSMKVITAFKAKPDSPIVSESGARACANFIEDYVYRAETPDCQSEGA